MIVDKNFLEKVAEEKKHTFISTGMSTIQNIDDAVNIKNTQIAEELALPPVKIHCSILAEDAIKAAISDYKNKAKVDGVSCC